MFVLKCKATLPASVASNFVFEVHPCWSFDFMTRIAMFCLREKFPGVISDAISFNFQKLSDYELEEEDVYFDLVYYVEEVFYDLLRA